MYAFVTEHPMYSRRILLLLEEAAVTTNIPVHTTVDRCFCHTYNCWIILFLNLLIIIMLLCICITLNIMLLCILTNCWFQMECLVKELFLCGLPCLVWYVRHKISYREYNDDKNEQYIVRGFVEHIVLLLVVLPSIIIVIIVITLLVQHNSCAFPTAPLYSTSPLSIGKEVYYIEVIGTVVGSIVIIFIYPY